MSQQQRPPNYPPGNFQQMPPQFAQQNRPPGPGMPQPNPHQPQQMMPQQMAQQTHQNRPPAANPQQPMNRPPTFQGGPMPQGAAPNQFPQNGMPTGGQQPFPMQRPPPSQFQPQVLQQKTPTPPPAQQPHQQQQMQQQQQQFQQSRGPSMTPPGYQQQPAPQAPQQMRPQQPIQPQMQQPMQQPMQHLQTPQAQQQQQMQAMNSSFQQMSTTTPSPAAAGKQRRQYPAAAMSSPPVPQFSPQSTAGTTPVGQPQQPQPPFPPVNQPPFPTGGIQQPPLPGGPQAPFPPGGIQQPPLPGGPQQPNFPPGGIQQPPLPGGPQQLPAGVSSVQYAQQPQFTGPGPFSHVQTLDYQQQQQQQQQQSQAAANKPRVTADSIPSHNSVQEADQDNWDKQGLIYNTTSRQLPPLASSEFVCVDAGQSSPRFIRATMYTVPTTSDLLNLSKIPLGIVVQPLAQLRSDERPVDVVDCGEKGPVRCNRCKAYINPLVRWVSGGQKFICNICEMVNDVPPEYFANLDMSGRRVDLANRPELCCGTVDFVATKDFCIRTPTPTVFTFLIDVSWNAVQSGMLQVATDTIKEMLDLFPIADDDQETCCKISIITFDRSIHFYNLSQNASTPQMMIVSDVDDVFVPIHDGFLVNPQGARDKIEALLSQLPKMFSSAVAANRSSEACLGAAVQAAVSALNTTGGRLIAFQTTLPTVGPGSLKSREDPKLLGTDKEKSLFSPQDDFYQKLAGKCVESGVGVDLFLFPNAYIDVASVGALSAISGGQTFMYPNFAAGRDGYRFAEDLRRSLTREFGYDSVLRVRCSNGVRVVEHYGNFYMRNSTDVEMGVIDSEKAVAVTFAHDTKLSENVDISFQVATLYTNVFGKRLIRVINISLPTTAQIGNIFRLAEMDTIINISSKSAISQTLSMGMASVREAITQQAAACLAAYRKFCASNNPPGQLILPESCKLYPLFAMCMLKSRAFKTGPEQTSDFRVFEMRKIRDMSVQTSVNFFYPRVFQITDLPQDSCQFDPNLNRFVLPPYTRSLSEKILQNCAYLIENGTNLLLWLGRDVDALFLRDVFGVNSMAEVDVSLRALPNFENSQSQKIAALLHYIQEEQRRGHYCQLQIIRQGDAFESLFKAMLVEDPEPGFMGYVDYLCHVHRMIQSLQDRD